MAIEEVRMHWALTVDSRGRADLGNSQLNPSSSPCANSSIHSSQEFSIEIPDKDADKIHSGRSPRIPC